MRLIDADALESKVLKWMPPDPCGVEEKEYPFETDICVSLMMEIQEAPTIKPMEWIPCSERLPEIGMKTILLYDSEEISGGTYIGNLTWNNAFASKNEFVKVIAWMPLPEPRKGIDDER